MNICFNEHVNNFDYEEYYTNTYSLWQNSRYYDTNNLSLGNITSKEWVDEGETATSIVPENKKMTDLTRKTLYKDPQLSYNDDYNEILNYNSTQSHSMYGWSQQNWVKAGHFSCDPEQGTSGNSKQTSNNKLEKKLNKALMKPAKMTKAESMMQKMGWQGGALGKTGDGILEPIAPNAVYASTTAGLGHRHQPLKQRKKQKHNKQIVPNDTERMRYFDTNILQNILKFVRNDLQVEMVFDKSLKRGDRKRVHNMVNEILNCECSDEEYDPDQRQQELIEKIYYYNCYLLASESRGKKPHRQLIVYKEAPKHVFLITPDDLKEVVIETEQLDIDVDESNQFLKSITKNIKEDEGMNRGNKTGFDRIVNYLAEFQTCDEYSELRFLGPFTGDEIKAVNKFLSDVNKCISENYSGVEENLVKLFKDGTRRFEISDDVNRSTVVYKVKKELE